MVQMTTKNDSPLLLGPIISCILKNLRGIDKCSAMNLLSLSYWNVYKLRAWPVLVQSGGLNNTLSPVVRGYIPFSINEQYNTN